jgi:hypothetical protein
VAARPAGTGWTRPATGPAVRGHNGLVGDYLDDQPRHHAPGGHGRGGKWAVITFLFASVPFGFLISVILRSVTLLSGAAPCCSSFFFVNFAATT